MQILKKQNKEDLIFMWIQTAEKEFSNKEEYFVPERGQVINIAVGMILKDKINIRLMCGNSEIEKIKNLNKWLTKEVLKNKKVKIITYGGDAYSLPFLAKRSIINGVEPHKLYDTFGLKQWELSSLDLMQIWRGTGIFNTSLEDLFDIFGIDYLKNDNKDINLKFHLGQHEEDLKEECKWRIYSICHLYKAMMSAKPLEIGSFEVDNSEEVKEVSLIESIKENGFITKTQEEKIIDISKEFDVKQKENLILLIDAALSLSKSGISKDLKDKILTN